MSGSVIVRLFNVREKAAAVTATNITVYYTIEAWWASQPEYV